MRRKTVAVVIFDLRSDRQHIGNFLAVEMLRDILGYVAVVDFM